MPKLNLSLNSSLTSVFGIRAGVFLLGKICLVLAVWFALNVANRLNINSRLTLPDITPIDTASSIAKQKPPFNLFEIVTKRNIFGVSASKTKIATAPVVASQLKLRLVGTSVSSRGAAFAIIEDTAKNSQEVFDLNEKVFDQATLVEILEDSVKLDRNGQIETLFVQDGDGKSAGNEVVSLNNDQTSFSIAEEELSSALANLPKLLSQARAVPYFRNGKSIGMRLFAIQKDSLYEKLGLKNGDIITAVNNNVLTDPAHAIRLFEQLKNERSIGVKVERSGENTDLSYSIR